MKNFVDVHADVSCDTNYVPSAIELVESEFPGSAIIPRKSSVSSTGICFLNEKWKRVKWNY